MKQPATKTEMNFLNMSPEEDNSSSNSTEYTFQDSTKKVPLDSQCSDIDAESQKFLPEHNLGKKKYETEYHQGNASFGMSVFNLGNAIMGSGILGLSYAMANTGIALFVILLMAVAIFSLYSVHLLLKTANEGGALVYEQLGYKAFGLPGKLAASFSITMQNIGGEQQKCFILCFSEWYTNGDYLVLIVTLAIILPLSLLRNLGELRVWFLKMDTVYAVPILSFAFVCHPAILPMYEELKDRSRRKMQGVANVSFLAMFIMYLLAALFGYLTFNVHVEPELLHTYSKIFKFDVVLLIVRLAVLTAVTLTVPVVLFPIRTSINQHVSSSKEFSWIRHTVITVVLLAGTNALVIFVPTIRDIFGFIGASAAAMLIFILPSAFYIKLVKKEPMKSMQKIGATAFLLCGLVVMVGSMTLIMMDWLQNTTASPEAPANGH
uniref:Sodium-coupled neutral amino acid symporter 2 n=1 Tax=Echeneis naucrates TaxID=173247 RepID=A0A665V4M9_ECHNA